MTYAEAFKFFGKFINLPLNTLGFGLGTQMNAANAPTVPFNTEQIGDNQRQSDGTWQRARWDGSNWTPIPGSFPPDEVQGALDESRRKLLEKSAAERKGIEEAMQREVDEVLRNPFPYLPRFRDIDQTCNRDWQRAQNFVNRRDPLVLDLDGDGIELIGASGAVLFDHNADNIKTGTGWARPDDGFLVRDLNGNGTIDTGRELFGVDTFKNNGGLATDGFDALRELDSNNDGVITNADTAFNELKVWRDLDQNGISTVNELFTLDQLNITSINTNGTATGPQAGQLINNNRVALSTTFTQNGQTRTVGAIDLEANSFFTQFPTEVVDTTGNPVAITAQAQGLPQMNGAGMVRDMRAAASLNAGFAAALTSFAAGTTRDEQRGTLNKQATKWAKTNRLAQWSFIGRTRC